MYVRCGQWLVLKIAKTYLELEGKSISYICMDLYVPNQDVLMACFQSRFPQSKNKNKLYDLIFMTKPRRNIAHLNGRGNTSFKALALR